MTDFNFAPQTAFEPIEITALQRTGLRNIKPRGGTETIRNNSGSDKQNNYN